MLFLSTLSTIAASSATVSAYTRFADPSKPTPATIEAFKNIFLRYSFEDGAQILIFSFTSFVILLLLTL